MTEHRRGLLMWEVFIVAVSFSIVTAAIALLVMAFRI